ncbi:ABC transporter permease [Rhodococcus sp. (in: high G+C Gram-positive bacteria)]|uniref:ABC transporter permease n=1 Tax=unclassified Rhodococcus (in: high G+C Gram-positive bacteria) TaxID=192944 RepID=UPI0025FF9013|nr:ABC transporter permease [Rhodococcus sp. (in: high G+C Gram-positive bacteria)]
MSSSISAGGPDENAGANAQADKTTRSSWIRLSALVAGLTAVVGVMLLAFALPAIHGGPHDMRLGLAGPSPAVDAVAGNLTPDEWDVVRFDTPEDLIAGIENREAAGGLVFAADGVDVYTATAGGAPGAAAVTALGTSIAQRQQVPVRTHELVAFPADDPRGAGLTAAALPMVFGGLIPAIALTQLFPGRNRLLLRFVGVVAFAVIAGAALTAILQFGTGSLAGNYWLTAEGLALGMGALALTVLGLEALLGPVGIGLGAFLMMFVGNPLSALGTGSNWLPDGWSTFGQLLPPGATGSLLRANAFFGGIGSGFPSVVLACWVAFGLVLALIAARREPRGATTAVDPE